MPTLTSSSIGQEVQNRNLRVVNLSKDANSKGFVRIGEAARILSLRSAIFKLNYLTPTLTLRYHQAT
jgi:hypothetical protein